MSEYKNKSVPEANSKTQVKRINVQKGRPAFYGLGWFTTDKPLPDGKYWWRPDSSSDEESVIIDVENGSFMYYLLTDVKQGKDHLYRIKLDRDFSGEWCRIVWPG